MAQVARQAGEPTLHLQVDDLLKIMADPSLLIYVHHT